MVKGSLILLSSSSSSSRLSSNSTTLDTHTQTYLSTKYLLPGFLEIEPSSLPRHTCMHLHRITFSGKSLQARDGATEFIVYIIHQLNDKKNKKARISVSSSQPTLSCTSSSTRHLLEYLVNKTTPSNSIVTVIIIVSISNTTLISGLLWRMKSSS